MDQDRECLAMTQVYDVFNDVALENVRRMIGVPLRRTFPYHEVATKDAIRHFAFGYGDTNPLWTDEEYVPNTRYGCIVAPPMFLCSCQSGVGGAANMWLPGAHALYQGDEWEWFKPILVDTRVTDEEKLVEFRETHGQFASKMYHQVGEVTFKDQPSELLAIKREIC